jgi:hypothetical protein
LVTQNLDHCLSSEELVWLAQSKHAVVATNPVTASLRPQWAENGKLLVGTRPIVLLLGFELELPETPPNVPLCTKQLCAA